MSTVDESHVDGSLPGEQGRQDVVRQALNERDAARVDPIPLAVLLNETMFVGLGADCRVVGAGGCKHHPRCAHASFKGHLPGRDDLVNCMQSLGKRVPHSLTAQMKSRTLFEELIDDLRMCCAHGRGCVLMARDANSKLCRGATCRI